MNSPGGKKTWVGGHSTKFASVQIWPRSLSAQKWIRLFQNRRWLLVCAVRVPGLEITLAQAPLSKSVIEQEFLAGE